MQYQTQENMNFMVQNNQNQMQNQMMIDGGNGVPVQQTTSDFEWLNLMNQESQQQQQWQQPTVQRRQRANTIATAQVPSTQASYQVINQQQLMNQQQQQQMLNQQQLINQQQQQIINQQQQQIISQPATIIINQTQPTTQQPMLVQSQPAQIIVQQQPQQILVQTSPQTQSQQIIVQETIPVTTQNSQFSVIAQQGRQRANTIPGSTAPPYPPQNTSSSPYNPSSQMEKVKTSVPAAPAGKIAISSNHTKSIPATAKVGMFPMMGFKGRDVFSQGEHLRKLDEELDKVDFDDVTVYELKELLRKRGLPSSGKKAILTERLLDEKKNAETRKRNFLEAEELRKKGQLGLCSPNQMMDIYGGLSPTQEIPVQTIPMAANNNGVMNTMQNLQPIMPMGLNTVKTRQRSYSDSRLTRPTLMENPIMNNKASPNLVGNSHLKNQISFQEYGTDMMQTDATTTTVVTTADPNMAYAQTQYQQINVQPQNVIYAQQPQQSYIQVQNMPTDASWNQNSNMSKYSSSLMI